MSNTVFLKSIAKLLRYYILVSTSLAGSGHPTSSLSSVEIITTLFFNGFFNVDLDNFENPNNDKLIFSKGHASPLFYSLYTVLGAMEEEELLTLRQFGSRLEGHPTRKFPFTEVPTGSLGQGIGVGVGEALYLKYFGYSSRVYVLLGDGELAEGSVWESLEIASKYKLNNLIAMVDVNRLGQSGETLDGYDIGKIKAKFEAFGWEAIIVDGHSFINLSEAFGQIKNNKKPLAIIAKTIKGKGAGYTENENGYHGKVLDQSGLNEVLAELGEVDKNLQIDIKKPKSLELHKSKNNWNNPFYTGNLANYKFGETVSTRKSFGETLEHLGYINQNLFVLDAETNISTYTYLFKNRFPDRFFEMYIAEQNMISTGVGLARRGADVIISTFGAFLTRAFDQIRMASYSGVDVNIVGSHCGCSIGQDGISQMALEDIAMFRSLQNTIVLYPSDAVSTAKLVEIMLGEKGVKYLRTTRGYLPVLYNQSENFKVGGSKILLSSKMDKVVLVSAGITLHNCLLAAKELLQEEVGVAVIDVYSIKPLDRISLLSVSDGCKKILVVEDHNQNGGIYGAVCEALGSYNEIEIYSLSVQKNPISGTPEEVMSYVSIDKKAIIEKVKEIV